MGIIWYDETKGQRSPEQNILAAVECYRAKFDSDPAVVLGNPKQVGDIEDVNGFKVQAQRNILLHHYQPMARGE